MDQKYVDILVQIFSIIGAPLLLGLVGIIIQYISLKLGLARVQKIRDELSVKQELVSKGIIFAEQAFKDAKGADKFKHVLDWVVAQLAIYKIKTTTAEIEVFIDSLVEEVKEQWRNATSNKLVE